MNQSDWFAASATGAALICAVQLWRLHGRNQLLRRESTALQNVNSKLVAELEEAAAKIVALSSENKNNGGWLLERVVEGLVGLGVPGLILLVTVSLSGFAGAAALTTALASLGGPLGMLGGVGVLLLLALTSRALTQFGLPRIATAVISGLYARGESVASIQQRLAAIPNFVVPTSIKRQVIAVAEGRSIERTATVLSPRGHVARAHANGLWRRMPWKR